MSNPITDSLNPEQYKAVTMNPESALVLAGAGSGKTRVLTSRIAYLLETRQAMIGEILAVTFTNKAAKEMLGRISSMVPFSTRMMWVGTFHGLCNRMLRMYHEEAGLPSSFSILDMSDQLSAIKRVMKANKISEEEVQAREVQRYINRLKEGGMRYKDVPDYPNPITKLKKHIYGLYEEVMNHEGSCDFAELLLRSYELLCRNEIIRRSFQDRFRFIMIDEFQDTNVLQYQWLKVLSGIEEEGAPKNIVFAVGDDDQSIYSFRGANVGNMQNFVQEFHVKDVIRLEQNYRSQGNILKAANELISNNSERLGKNLWTESGDGEPIRVWGAYNEQEEADYVVSTIKQYLDEGMEKSDIAILYRSNAQSRALETELRNRNIPYRVYGGLRFYDRAEIKNAIAYMRLAENTNDDTAFLRVVNFPTRGIGVKTMENLIDYAKDHKLSLYESAYEMGGMTSTKLKPFLDIVDDLRVLKMSADLKVFVQETIKRSGLENFYLADKNGEEKIENLRELSSAAQALINEERLFGKPAGVSEEEGLSPLGLFLAGATLDSGEAQSDDVKNSVQLMTVHASKGLEFKAVFITGLEEGLFPHDSALRENGERGLQEERRLFYVAITRAQKYLYLTFAQQRMLHGRTLMSRNSKFFQELPEETLKWLTPKPKARPLFGESDIERTRSSAFEGLRKNLKNDEYKPKSDKVIADEIKEKRDPLNPFKTGTRFRHEKFGRGVVLATVGMGDDQQLVVKLENGKQLRLLTRIAKKKMEVL